MLNGYKIRDWAYLLLRGRETIAERKRVKGTLRRAGLGYKSFKDAMENGKFEIKDPLTGEDIPRTFKGIANGRTIMGHYKTVNRENIISSWWIIQ